MKQDEFEAAVSGYQEGRKDTVISYGNMIRRQRSFYQKNNENAKADAMSDLLKIMGAERTGGYSEYVAKVKVTVEMTVTFNEEKNATMEAIDEAIREEIAGTICDEIDRDTELEIKSIEQIPD